MKRYFIEYESSMNHEFNNPETGEKATLRKSLRTQAEKLANHIKGVAAYSPFKLDI